MLERVLDFLFPLECIACGAPRSHCCTACTADVAMTPKIFDADDLRVFSAFAYANPIVRKLISDLKYHGWTAASPPIAALTRRATVKFGAGLTASVIVPIPLSRMKMRARGFNQAEIIAQALSETMGTRVRAHVLVRRRDTKPQTDVRDRGMNVAGAFLGLLPPKLRGADILLVDDVWTSGSTMRECAAALRAAGAGRITGFTLAWGSGLHKEPPRTVR
jgi:competence protein ComFC